MLLGIFWLVETLIHLYILAIIAAVVISLLGAFGVIDPRNRYVYSISDFLNRLTEPALAPIRRILPDLGNIDISPIIAILILEAIESYMLPDIYAMLVLHGLNF